MLGRERDGPRTKQRRVLVKLVLALDNVFFVFVQILLRVFRMTPFVGANIFFGAVSLLLGFWILCIYGIYGREAPGGGLAVSAFWIIGGAIILATLIKKRDPAFAKEGTRYLHVRCIMPWYAFIWRLVRVVAMISTLAMLLFVPGFLLQLALFSGVCASYARAVCLFEYEKKHRS